MNSNLKRLLLATLSLVVGLSACARFSPENTSDKMKGGPSPMAPSCPINRACIIAYVSPNCAVCHRSIPLFHHTHKKFASRNDLGFLVIVGGADPKALRDFADEFDFPVVLDRDGSAARALSIAAYPTWALLDDSKNLVSKTTGGAPRGSANRDQLLCAILSQRLKVPRFTQSNGESLGCGSANRNDRLSSLY